MCFGCVSVPFQSRYQRRSNLLRSQTAAPFIISSKKSSTMMAAEVRSTKARSERADATLADRTSFAERVSSAYDKGESISIDIAQDPHNMEMFLRYAQAYGGNSAAAHALMSAELARQYQL